MRNNIQKNKKRKQVLTIISISICVITIGLQFTIPIQPTDEYRHTIYEDPNYTKMKLDPSSIKIPEGFLITFQPTSNIGEFSMGDLLLPGGSLYYDLDKKIPRGDAYVDIEDQEPIVYGYYEGKAKVITKSYSGNSGVSYSYHIELPKEEVPKGTELEIGIPVSYEVRRDVGGGVDSRMLSTTFTTYYEIVEPMKETILKFSIPINDYNLALSKKYEADLEELAPLEKKYNYRRFILLAIPIIFSFLLALLFKWNMHTIPGFVKFLHVFVGAIGALIFILALDLVLGLILGGLTLVYYILFARE